MHVLIVANEEQRLPAFQLAARWPTRRRCLSPPECAPRRLAMAQLCQVFWTAEWRAEA